MIRRSALLAVISAALTAATPRAAAAGAPATWHGTIDGVAVWITVVPRGHEIPAETRRREPWSRWGNVTSDAYLFAVRRPESVRLILDFRRRADGGPEARIHLNDMGRRDLAYTIDADSLQVHSNRGAPYLTMSPAGGAWRIGGKADYNLSLSIDGPMRDIGPPHVETDGQVDVAARVGGREPGVADWQTYRLVNDRHPGWAYLRFTARQRMPGAPRFKAVPGAIPGFPHFALGAARIDWFTINPPPLYFDVTSSEFRLHGFPGFHTGGMYEVNSVTFPPRTDVETPFVFYAFDPQMRHAQLVVRAHSMPAGDTFGPEPWTMERSTFRYSWKTVDETRWAYSLGFAGSHRYAEQVRIGEERLFSVPWDTLPTWVTSKVWPVVTLVEAVDGYPGSEGIYFYSAQAYSVWPWLSDTRRRPPDFLAQPILPRTDQLTADSTESLPVGFRGEYDAASSRPARLYVSPIDHRVHLLNAQGGLWNLGHGWVLRGHNLDRGPHIDGWTRERIAERPDTPTRAAGGSPVTKASPGIVDEALYALAGFLIYSGRQGAELRQLDHQPAPVELAPPTDAASWRLFRERLAPYRRQPRRPEDLRTWFAHLPGKRLVVADARISDVRPIRGGFRLVLDLPPGSRVEHDDLGSGSLRQGAYVVTYDGRLSVEPALARSSWPLVLGVSGGLLAVLVLMRRMTLGRWRGRSSG
jgi:hypothetical protein